MKSIKYSKHALQRMFTRSISPEEVDLALRLHEVIHEYPEDKPYPSRLVLGKAGTRRLHIVYADVPQTSDRIIITVYEPDDVKWDSEFQVRIDR